MTAAAGTFSRDSSRVQCTCSWTIWSWNAPGSCSQPSVIADMNGTPLAGQGQLIHDTFMALPG